MTDQLIATIVDVKSGSWKWGIRCEVRVHRADVDPKGRGYRDRCEAVYGDLNRRHTGPRSEFGQLLQRLREEGVLV